LSAGVAQAETLNELLRHSDAVTIHVPLVDETRGIINSERLAQLDDEAILLNFSRGAIVDEAAVIDALDKNALKAYICDFPSEKLRSHPKVTSLPHLGASTFEAEDNCAVMVAEHLKDYLEQGNVRHSVNFPEAVMPRGEGVRVTIANANVPNMVGQISTCLAKANLNIIDMLNKSQGDLAYTLVDVDQAIPQQTLDQLNAIDGVLRVRFMNGENNANR
ncbi:MAG: phosphoglycerate dehydrogenase, partial [Pseudomonadota bacterium]